MATVTDLVADSRGFDGSVVEIPSRKTPYTYSDFAQNIWKSGNLLGHYGVHPGAEVTVVVAPKREAGAVGQIDAADPLFAILGATLVGAAVRLQPVEPVNSRALVVPASWTGRYDTEPGCSVVAYGGPPDDASVAHFETEMWSQNPTAPPESVGADDPAIRTADGTFTHEMLLAVATAIETEYDIQPGDSVVLDAPLTEPGALVAGVLTTVSAGATLGLSGGRDEDDAALVVTENESDRENTIQVSAVSERLRDTRRV